MSTVCLEPLLFGEAEIPTREVVGTPVRADGVDWSTCDRVGRESGLPPEDDSNCDTAAFGTLGTCCSACGQCLSESSRAHRPGASIAYRDPTGVTSPRTGERACLYKAAGVTLRTWDYGEDPSGKRSKLVAWKDMGQESAGPLCNSRQKPLLDQV
ncbi:hypothetical protein NDU88_007369 [Pleurodeles waltl]|uniref:Uncharacterized protein n=1 Tax=Pleurodeles waltl TaxID=8319 RepID=A0AAV7UQG0_PLEWA|nr:hypothetical protein NDU88_007369 [Pleurodeles waltl]